MKKIYLVLICLLFSFCKKEDREPMDSNVVTASLDIVEQFINTDITGDYKLYFDHLSSSYKSILYKKYSTTNDLVVFDSLKDYNYDLHNEINIGKFTMTNKVIKTIETEIEGISIIKYRSSLYDHKNKSELFKEEMLLKIVDSSFTSFIPYTKNYTPNIDSLIRSTYNTKTLTKLHKTLKFEKFNSNDPILKKIDQEFQDYIVSFKSEDNRLFDFLYPPIMNEILKQSGETLLTSEIKTMLVDHYKEALTRQTLEFDNIYIDDIQELNCDNNKKKYLLSYVIDVKKNIFIPGQAVVFVENDRTYFIEFDKSEFETTLSEIFDSNFIKCLVNETELIKKKLGLK